MGSKSWWPQQGYQGGRVLPEGGAAEGLGGQLILPTDPLQVAQCGAEEGSLLVSA